MNADLKFLDKMIDKVTTHRNKHNLKPVCFLIPGYGFGCIYVKKDEYKDFKKIEVDGFEIELIGLNDKRNPFNA